MIRRVLAYGDSNTFGSAPMAHLGDQSVHPRGARWPDQMARDLGDGWEVVVEGLGGRTAAYDDPIEGAYRNGLTILPAILHSHKPIDLLIVCLGTNDQKARFGLGAQDVALGLQRLLQEARASGTVGAMLAVCPPPLRPAGALAKVFAGAAERGAGLPAELARVATGADAGFFDAGEVISVDPLDGIHWNAQAHKALGAALAAQARALAG